MELEFIPTKAFMLEALQLAQIAFDKGEVPVGAVVVKNGEIIGRGRNRRECDKNATAHAEIEAINEACKNLNSWRLNGCELYVTLEPCPMCAGAIINSRIDTVVYGADDDKAGSCGSLVNLFSLAYNHSPKLIRGFMEWESREILQSFFKKLR